MAKYKTFRLMPNGSIGKEPEWVRRKESTPDAWGHKRYDNGKIALTLTARDRIHTNGAIPPEHWIRFDVSVQNIIKTDFEGNLIDPPKYVTDVDASSEFRTLEEATNKYQLLLAQYTESAFNTTTGRFEEQGNIYNPDIPKVAESSAKAKVEDFGSW